MWCHQLAAIFSVSVLVAPGTLCHRAHRATKRGPLQTPCRSATPRHASHAAQNNLPAVEILENSLARTGSARALPYLARLNVVVLQLDAGLPMKARRTSLPRLRRTGAQGRAAIHDSARAPMGNVAAFVRSGRQL